MGLAALLVDQHQIGEGAADIDAEAVAFADARRLAAHQRLRTGRQRAARHVLLHLPKARLELADALFVPAHRIVGIAHR